MSKGRDNDSKRFSFLSFNSRESRNVDPDQVLLDNEMDKVFAETNGKRKFHVARLGGGALKPIILDKDSSAPSTPNDGYLELQYLEQQPVKSFQLGDNDDDDDGDNTVNSKERPIVSERAGFGDHSDSSDEERHVQFKEKTEKKEVIESPEKGVVEFDERKRRKSRHLYYKHRKYSHQDSFEGRRPGEIPNDSRKISIQPEDSNLEDEEEADLNELTSHRSDDPRALRRHKFHHASAKFKELPAINLPASSFSLKKTFDHSPHEVFVQLDELLGTGDEREWKETARWIKYEEDIEEGSDRWGRPHVASLCFHSLLNLRRCLETGVVLLDLEERDLPGVAYRVVEQMVIEDLIRSDDKPALMRALLLKHRHVNEHSHNSFPFGKKKCNSYTSLQYLWMGENGQFERGPRTSVCSAQSAALGINLTAQPHVLYKGCRRHSTVSYISNFSDDKKAKIIPANEINGNNKKSDFKIDMKEETYSSSQEDFKKLQSDTILRRIPMGAEATTVLVGAVDFLDNPTMGFVRLAESTPMPSITEVPIPVRFLFILLGPKTIDLDYHEVGRSIATLMSNEHFQKMAYKADERKALLSAINEFLDISIVLPPGNWDRHELLSFEELKTKKDWIRSRKNQAIQEKNKEEKVEEEKKLLAAAGEKKPPSGPLEKTNRCWGGLINDIKRRIPMYKSDILDGLNTETLAAAIFMYFACLSTAITFGGLASDKTHNMIGISETLLAGSIVGLVFHAVSGQPLAITGTTGPLLLFDEALYKFCSENGFEFLTVRVYVGIWLFVIALLVSAVEGSVYVRLLTRFTQEIFSALITLIYIYETFVKLISVYGKHPLLAEYIYKVPKFIAVYGNDDEQLLPAEDATGPINQPNTALFCTILTLGTFTVAYYLKLFRNSHFLGRNARRALGDFGVPIAIAIFVLIDYLIPEVFTEKLRVPEGLSPSSLTRKWLIPFGPVPIWLPFLAAVPAILVYILIFMETHISELIVDKPERGLKKGSGLHLDIVLICLLNTFCGIFGMPWHCAATVRSVAHVSAVTIMSRTHAPGETPKITEVKEQRLSGLFVSIMVGLSVLMAPLLRKIPMAVLFGVFLYMGIASMIGVQFFDRMRLFFMPQKHHPETPYVKRVQTWKMHAYTVIQIVLLGVLWTVKSTKISLAFPFFLIIMVPIRMKLSAIYTPQEMAALDGSQSIDEDEQDFYEQATIPA